MNLRKQKELASRTLGISKKRVKLNIENKEQLKNVKDAISRENIKELLEDNVIIKKPKKGNSRTRANKIIVQKKKGRRQGQGSRKGTANARFNTKTRWIIKIRALRGLLKELKDSKRLEDKVYRNLYRKSKGNFFRNKRHMFLYIKQNNLLKEVKKDEK